MNRQRIAELFDQAIEIAPENLEAWLTEHCGDDTALRAQLQHLLRADAKAADFMEVPPPMIAAVAASASSASVETPGVFGVYRVLRSLGTGGMGEVWLAERSDGEFEQRVAIKQLAYPTPGLLQRFRQERQILARLEHPNIARLLDGGVDASGAPYLVMEYVEGMPITEYVRAHAVDLRACLRLFLRVCDGVQYAHQNLIVHRDLKPSNIFVSTDGVPKLLDFGIAKVLATTDEAAATQTAARLLTPDYAAPEQFSGGAITTATDVYALGVVLYQLLADTRPPRRAGDAANSTIEPPPPSVALDRTTGDAGARRRALRGDLDRIALTALAAEPQRRYASAEALANDIRLYLDGRPIAARSDSAWYRLRKYAGRNRYVLAAATIAFAVCLGATFVSLHQASRALDQAQRAEAVRQFLVDIFSQVNPDENHGQPITASLLLQKSEQRLTDAPMADDLRADLTTLMGTFYWKLADDVAAERTLTKVPALAEHGKVPDLITARSLAALARVELDMRKTDSAYAHAASAQTLALRAGTEGADVANNAAHLLATLSLQRDGPEHAAAMLHDLLSADRVAHGDSQMVVDDLTFLGSVLHSLSRYDEAESALQEAIAKSRALNGPYHTSVAFALVNLGMTRLERGDYAGADQAFNECLALIERFFGKESVRGSIVRSHLLESALLQGQMEASLPALLIVQDEARAQQAARPDHVMGTTAHLGDAYLGLGRMQDAETAYRQTASASSAGTASWAVVALKGLGDTLQQQGRYDEAETAYRSATTTRHELRFPGSHGLNSARAALGNNMRLQHRFAEALSEVSAADRAVDTAIDSQDPIVATIKAQLAEAQLDAGDARQAQATATAALAIARHVLPTKNWQLGTALFALARTELALGHATKAEPLLREALAVRSPPHPANDPRVLEVKAALVNVLAAQNKKDEAAALRAEIEPLQRASPSPHAVDLLAFGEKLTMRGESVQVQGANPLTIHGSFYVGPALVRAEDVPGSGSTQPDVPQQIVASHGTGGACLIADLNFKGIPELGNQCQADLDCTKAIPQKYTGDYTDENNNKKTRGWHSYCVAGTCWTRPGPQGSHCWISAIHNGGNPWSTGSHQFGPPAVSTSVYTIADMYRELAIEGSVKWRIHTCLNGSGITSDNTACKDSIGLRLVENGPIYSVP